MRAARGSGGKNAFGLALTILSVTLKPSYKLDLYEEFVSRCISGRVWLKGGGEGGKKREERSFDSGAGRRDAEITSPRMTRVPYTLLPTMGSMRLSIAVIVQLFCGIIVLG